MGKSSITVNEEVLTKLIDVGIALSATTDLTELLKLVTTEARRQTFSDAASLFLAEDDRLRFIISQNKTLDARSKSSSSRIFEESTIPINSDSIVGYVAETKTIEIVDDAYDIPSDRPYKHSKIFDEENSYHTKSIIAVPMLDVDGELIGVLQLLNHMDIDGNLIPYPEVVLPLIRSLASQAGVAVKNAKLRDELKQVHHDTIIRLSSAAEFRDNETAKHVQRVALYSRLIARQLNLPSEDRELIYLTAPMHDIGKIGIPDKILLKPGRFTPEERTIMEQHAEIGARIMEGSSSKLIQTCRMISLTHHEKFDGSGYPNKLAGENIPLVGRIVAVADVFDAITSRRCYKDAVPMDDVLPILKKESGNHFDPACVEAFFSELQTVRNIHEEYCD